MLLKNITTYCKPLFPFAFWMLISIVTMLLLMEHTGAMVGFPHMDKIIHAILFAMLTTIGYLAYSNYSRRLYLGLMGYGIMTEIMQGALTITRYASIYDWIADTVGILLAIFSIKIIESYSAMKTPHVS